MTERNARARQSGYSLVELSVAMAVALFLLAGFFSILQSTRNASTSTNQLAQLQDNERIALTMLTSVIQAGGYYPDPDTNTIDSQLPASGLFTNVGQVVYGAANATAALGDTLTVRYNAGANEDVIDCKGTTNASSATAASYVNQFLIRQDAANTPPYLACTTDGGATFAKLVSNVTRMDISYGINSTAALANTTGVPVDSYLATPDMVIAAAKTPILWTNVFSIKVKLTFTNPLASRPGQPVVPGQPPTLDITKVIGIMSRIGVNVVSFQ